MNWDVTKSQMVPKHRAVLRKASFRNAVLLALGLVFIGGVCKKKPNQQAPLKPAVPEGPTSGWVDSLYTFTVVTSDPQGNDVAYRVAWGATDTSSWSPLMPSDTPSSWQHRWQRGDTYSVTAQAKDDGDSLSGWSNGLAVVISELPNNPPTSPRITRGTGGQPVGVECYFTVEGDDPDHDSVGFRFDWGDGDTSSWSACLRTAFYIGSHTYSRPGDFVVRSQAKDCHGALSTWSDGHDILINTPDFPWRCTDTIPGVYGLGMVLLPNAQYLYVAGGDSVHVIRTSDNTVVARLWLPCPAGNWVNCIAASSDGGRVYVLCAGLERVYAISTSSETIVDSMTFESTFSGIAVTPDGAYLYVPGYTNMVFVARTSDNQVIASIPVGQPPRDVTVRPDGQYAYVANVYSQTVSVIRTSDNQVVATIPVQQQPSCLAASHGGDYVYVGGLGTGQIEVIRTSDNTVSGTWSIGYGPWYLATPQSGNYLYCSNFGVEGLLVIRVSDGRVVAVLPIGIEGEGINGIAMLPDGSKAYAARSDGILVLTP